MPARWKGSGRARPVSFAEPLEERVLMAMSLKVGGSGYSNLLATDSAALRQQKLICDPPEPLEGSVSTQYDPRLVSLRGASPGPGYANEKFGGAVEVLVGDKPQLQDLASFLREPIGKETGYVQIHYALSGQAGQIAPPRDWLVLDEGGTEGIDTHSLDFAVLPNVSSDNEFSYHVFAAKEGQFSGNGEDFLVTNDGTNTRLGPGQLTPADSTTRPKDGSVAGTVFEDTNANGVMDREEKPMGGVLVFVDLDRDGKPGDLEPHKPTNELGGYFFDDLPEGGYVIREVVPPGYKPIPDAREAKVTNGRRERGQDFGNVPPPPNQPPTAVADLTNVTGPGTNYWFKVSYADDSAVNFLTIGNGDVRVTGPGGFSALGSLSNLTVANGVWTTTYRITAPGGSWNAPDNGTYTVSMEPNQVADNAGAFVPAGVLGQFTVQLGDLAAPTAALVDAPNVTSPGGTNYWFKVSYADDVAVNYPTIGTGDVRVTGPAGFSAVGILSNLTVSGGVWTTTYRVVPPGGAWDAADSGSYAISMEANQVTDTSGKPVPAGVLGSFAVRVGDSIPPTATLLPSSINPGGPYHWFTVNYADNAGVNYTNIDSNDVVVTGPGGYSQAGVLSNLTVSGGVWSATYRIVPPGGTWNAADNGTYTVTMQAGQVSDTSGNFVPAGSLGTFTVSLTNLQASTSNVAAAATDAAAPQTVGEVVGVTPARRKPLRRAGAFLG